MVDAIIDLRVWIARAFGAKLPNRPVLAVLGVEELDKRVERIAVCALWVCAAGAGRRNDCT
jgi:hypothetical protein